MTPTHEPDVQTSVPVPQQSVVTAQEPPIAEHAPGAGWQCNVGGEAAGRSIRQVELQQSEFTLHNDALVVPVTLHADGTR